MIFQLAAPEGADHKAVLALGILAHLITIGANVLASAYYEEAGRKERAKARKLERELEPSKMRDDIMRMIFEQEMKKQLQRQIELRETRRIVAKYAAG